MNGLQAILAQVEAKYMQKHTSDFKPGDNLKLSLKVKEGEKERIQIFEGTVIGRDKDGLRETFRLRRIASGVGVERVFPMHSPSIVKIQVTKRGVASRAKLYYLKGKSGKDARIAEARREDTVVGHAAAVPVAPAEAPQAAPATEAAKA